MKQVYLGLLAFLMYVSAHATTITADSDGDWNTTGSWDLNRQPQDNDTIVIPVGITITLDFNVTRNNVVIIIKGTLEFNNGKLRLDAGSRVIVDWDGEITGINSNDQLTINNVLKFSGNEGTLSGYGYADVTTGTSPNGFVSVTLPVTNRPSTTSTRPTAESTIKVFASSRQTLTVALNGLSKEKLTVQLISMNGQVIAAKVYSNAQNQLYMNFNAPAGIYAVRVTDGQALNVVKKIAL